MKASVIATKVLPALDRALRGLYTENYAFRCYQASIALDVFLSDMGLESRVVAGDFQVATLDQETGKLEWHGFVDDTYRYSHFWVEACGHLIDVMPRYIPRGLEKRVLQPPMVVWDMQNPLPECFWYRVRDDNPPLGKLMTPFDHEGINLVLKSLRKRLAAKPVAGGEKAFIMKPSCIPGLAGRHDRWASWVMLNFPGARAAGHTHAGRVTVLERKTGRATALSPGTTGKRMPDLEKRA